MMNNQTSLIILVLSNFNANGNNNDNYGKTAASLYL